MWQPAQIPFTIRITEPEKKSKFKGMKSYISYHLQPSVSLKSKWLVQHFYHGLDFPVKPLTIAYYFIITQWAKSPKKQSVGVYF